MKGKNDFFFHSSKYEEEMQTALAMSHSLSHNKVSKKSEPQQSKHGKKKKA